MVLQSHHPAATSLPTALLLAATGGLLDALVYLNHGHVFASAMTGNAVLMGVAGLGHDWTQATRHLVPIGAFLAGVAGSKLLQSKLRERAAMAGLLFEAAALFAVSLFPPAFPQMAFTALIAFVSAYQVSSFREVDEFSYNSTFITGNLRSVADGLDEARHRSTRALGLRKFRDLGLVCVCFVMGALAGAAGAHRIGDYTLWIAIVFLLAAAMLVRARGRA